MGSQSWLVSQHTRKQLHSVLIVLGPKTVAPLLLNTTNMLFTIWSIWLGPTAMFVSGGTPVMMKPGKPTPSPGKLLKVAGICMGPAFCCTTGSWAGITACGLGKVSGALISDSNSGNTKADGISRNGGETSKRST